MMAVMHVPLYINGARVDAPSRTTVVAPFTRKPVATVALADERTIDRAVESAHAASSQSRRLAPFERSAILSATAAGIERRHGQRAVGARHAARFQATVVGIVRARRDGFERSRRGGGGFRPGRGWARA